MKVKIKLEGSEAKRFLQHGLPGAAEPSSLDRPTPLPRGLKLSGPKISRTAFGRMAQRSKSGKR